MHEGIEKVENVLKQESSEIINNFNVRKIEESKMNLEAINIAEAPSTERIEVEMITDEAQTKATEIAKNKAKCMEGIKIIQENIVDLAKSLEDSIWAPREERCEIIKDIKAKISAANMLGENLEHRAKSLKWALRGNSHVKRIYEEFSKGNQWYVLVFDCEKGFKDAQKRLAERKEEHEQFRLKKRRENEKKKDIEQQNLITKIAKKSRKEKVKLSDQMRK